MSSLDRLVYMANQIAANFAAQGEAAATKEVARHIVSFWDPRMKQLILEHLESGGEGLSAISKAALAEVSAQGGNG